MPRSSRKGGGGSGSAKPKAAPVAMPVAVPVALSPSSHVELDQRSSSRSSPQQRQREDEDEAAAGSSTIDIDDASAAHPSTAGDPFYDALAAVERLVTACSLQLKELIQTLKKSKANPQQARELRQTLDEQLEEAGRSLHEIQELHTQFDSFNVNGADKAKKNERRAQVDADIDQMRGTYTQIRSMVLAQINKAASKSGSNATTPRSSSSRGGNAAESQALLSGGDSRGFSGLGGGGSSVPASQQQYQQQQQSLIPDSHGLTYQNTEYLGDDLDGHLAMLASSARDRAELMQSMQKDVVQVAALFADVNYMVNQQQSMVDAIDQNIEQSHSSALRGYEQLEQARDYQTRKRKNMCCLFLLAILALFTFLLFLWVAYGGN